MDEIKDIFSSGEKMIEDFEKGNYMQICFSLLANKYLFWFNIFFCNIINIV